MEALKSLICIGLIGMSSVSAAHEISTESDKTTVLYYLSATKCSSGVLSSRRLIQDPEVMAAVAVGYQVKSLKLAAMKTEHSSSQKLGAAKIVQYFDAVLNMEDETGKSHSINVKDCHIEMTYLTFG